MLTRLTKNNEINLIKQAFENSYKYIIVFHDKKIIGAGRMLSDGICYATIFDLCVSPEYQKQGIGKQIVQKLMTGDENLCFHITSTFGNEAFYQKLGFQKNKTAYAKYPYKSDYLID